ncbi:septum site-determining protein MinC [Pseudoruegeria sp. SK021]|nr:septum site-determining protein MinC [Pseudoruegeria sp. SK021]
MTPVSVKPFQIRGRFFTAVALRPEGDADQAFYDALDVQLRHTPNFFANAPFVIDLEQTDSLTEARDLVRLIEEMRHRKLSVFGVQNGTATQTATAVKAGLISLPSGRDVPVDRVERSVRQAPEMPDEAPEAPQPASLLITEPVRSGQKIFADRGDLVVVSSVGAGAELIAVGNIHVYGHLRGRALAGVNGDTTARIFCQGLDAELLAIAGLYRTSEDLGPAIRKQRVQAFLMDDKLCVEPLK